MHIFITIVCFIVTVNCFILLVFGKKSREVYFLAFLGWLFAFLNIAFR